MLNHVTAQRPKPAFEVLDVVEIAPLEPMPALGLAGRRGTVLSVREYPGSLSRYSVGCLPSDPDYDEVPGLYSEEYLKSTGLRSEATAFGPPPPFHMRDVVTMSDDCDVEGARGASGYISGCAVYEADRPILCVRVDGSDLDVYLDATFVTRTGERLPPPPKGRTGHSTQVSPTGVVTGRSEFTVIDHIENHL